MIEVFERHGATLNSSEKLERLQKPVIMLKYTGKFMTPYARQKAKFLILSIKMSSTNYISGVVGS